MAASLRFTSKTEAYPLTLLVAAYALGFFFYTQFPDRIASHWNFAGEVNGYSGKFLGAFLIPLIMTGIYALFRFLPSLDPRNKRYPEFADVYHNVRYSILTVLFLIYLTLGMFNLGFPVQVGMVVPILIGGMMVLFGTWMPQIKPNWFMGIRTPWTLSSDSVWNKTHNVGGRLFTLLGVLLIIVPFVEQRVGFALFISGILATVAGTVGYSYILFSRERRKKR